MKSLFACLFGRKKPKEKLKVALKKMHPKVQIPSYATIGSAGLDMRAMINEPLEILPGAVHLIPTGIALDIRDPDYAGFLLPRSGLGHKHGIVLGNLTGLIDSDYTGEIFVSCWNRSQKAFVLEPEERLAQLVIQPVMQIEVYVVDEFGESTRGAGGFGSTGTK